VGGGGLGHASMLIQHPPTTSPTPMNRTISGTTDPLSATLMGSTPSGDEICMANETSPNVLSQSALSGQQPCMATGIYIKNATTAQEYVHGILSEQKGPESMLLKQCAVELFSDHKCQGLLHIKSVPPIALMVCVVWRIVAFPRFRRWCVAVTMLLSACIATTTWATEWFFNPDNKLYKCVLIHIFSMSTTLFCIAAVATSCSKKNKEITRRPSTAPPPAYSFRPLSCRPRPQTPCNEPPRGCYWKPRTDNTIWRRCVLKECKQ
jgi:hypothetical protein